jgi:hypothetical protein
MDEAFNGLNLNPTIQQMLPNTKPLLSTGTVMNPAPENRSAKISPLENLHMERAGVGNNVQPEFMKFQ